jgi:hypothetical protein
MRRTLLGLIAGVLALAGFAWSATPARADHHEWHHHGDWHHGWYHHHYRPWYGGAYYAPYYGGTYYYAPYRSYYYAPYPAYYYGGYGFGYQGPRFGFYVTP